VIQRVGKRWKRVLDADGAGVCGAVAVLYAWVATEKLRRG
jgi:hypothetical protein